MDAFFSEVRQSFRNLIKNPGFTLVASGVLALGIGANTVVFTVLNTVLLRPLPYPNSEQLVVVGRKFPEGFGDSVSIPNVGHGLRVLVFTAGLSIFTGILFGILPAIRYSRPDVTSVLQQTSGRSGTGVRQNRTRGVLVISEITLALILLAGRHALNSDHRRAAL